MASMFKGIGKGCLYVLMFPLGIIAIALFAVYGVFVFFYQLVRLLILFFTGRNLNSDLPEDIEAKRILGRERENKDLSLFPSDSIVYDTEGYSAPIYKEEEKPVEAPKHFEEEPEVKDEADEEGKEESDDEYFDHLV